MTTIILIAIIQHISSTGMTGAVMLLAFLVDVCVWYLAESVSFEDDTASSTSLGKSPSTEAPTLFPAPHTASTSQESTPMLPQCQEETSFILQEADGEQERKREEEGGGESGGVLSGI